MGLYIRALRRFSRGTFRFWERLGVHVTPNHFSQPIPDTRTLSPGLWMRESELVGIDLREAQQLELLSRMELGFRAEYETIPRGRTDRQHTFSLENPYFNAVDAEVLYSMIRLFHPQRILEVGSGFSTYLMAEALLRNAAERSGPAAGVTVIDPHPNEVVRAGFPGLGEVLDEPVEEVPLRRFGALRPNDVLFIDSSHVLRIGGDVQFLYLEVLPRLAPGVLVHIHDIFLPAEYPKRWVLEQFRFLSEQYLLQAFLAFNGEFEVLWAGQFMHLRHPDDLARAFPSYERNRTSPGSFWIRRRERAPAPTDGPGTGR